MKKRDQAIVLKSAYVLLVTFVVLAGLAVASYNGFSTAWSEENKPKGGGTLQVSHINEMKAALDAIFTVVTFDPDSVTVQGDISSTGSICDGSGNCVEDVPALECTSKMERFDGAGWKNVNVFCDSGYIRTGCSINYNAGDGGTWGNAIVPIGNEGCACGSGMTSGWVECYAVCCRIV